MLQEIQEKFPAHVCCLHKHVAYGGMASKRNQRHWVCHNSISMSMDAGVSLEQHNEDHAGEANVRCDHVLKYLRGCVYAYGRQR